MQKILGINIVDAIATGGVLATLGWILSQAIPNINLNEPVTLFIVGVASAFVINFVIAKMRRY